MIIAKKVFNLFSMGFLFFMISFGALATSGKHENPDDKLPLEIESDNFVYNSHTGVATYTGHVVADQGTRHLTADILNVYRTEHDDISKIIAQGKPAHFKLKPSLTKPMVYGEANTIQFFNNTQEIQLLDNAVLIQNEDTYRAPIIHYDIQKEIVTSPESKKGRIKIILQPQNK